MIFVVPSDVPYRSFPLVGGPTTGKSVLVPCDSAKQRGESLVPSENFRSLNLAVNVEAIVSGSSLVVSGGKQRAAHSYYVYASEPNAFVYVEERP